MNVGQLIDWIRPRRRANGPLVKHYHYHSFPRRWRDKSECNAMGLAILNSVVESGLLLTPERVEWPGEFKAGNRLAQGPVSYHKRVCFTYLVPQELTDHAKEFGPFSIEFENWELRTLGAMPVFYIPTEAEFRGFLGVGIALACRLADIQSLLERLKLFLEMAESCDDKLADIICVPIPDGGFNVRPNRPGAKMVSFPGDFLRAIKEENQAFEMPRVTEAAPFGANAGGLQSLLSMLTWKIQSYEIQLGAIQSLGGYFYPSERLGQSELLSYYRQREWRILDSLQKDGVRASRQLTEVEKQSLTELDKNFFDKPIHLRDGKSSRIVDECAYLTKVEGNHVLQYARRIVCPRASSADVRATLRHAGLSHVKVCDFEDAHNLS